MPFSQSKINNFSPGDYLSANTLNTIGAAASAAGVQNPSGGGVNSLNGSSGNSFCISENISRPAIWAQIVSINRVSSPISGSGSSSGSTSSCPNFVYAYGWIELIEDINISRSKQEFFYIKTSNTVSSSGSGSNSKIINGSSSDQSVLECRDINILNESVGGMTGNQQDNPAYEVNNQVVSLGTVVKLYFGNGAYMLFNNSGSSKKGTVENVQCVGNVLRVTYTTG